ncbi:hypothetical protein niasHS_012611 [Heterodera schachtii]|uniref:Pseudouridine synthase RsuA/RluA-like domain-containing protein n=1 Tax=Heterodera schachtii TaxID=97005 RepID=A0ABD2I9G9_HETSC
MGLRCVRPDGQEALSSFSLLRYLPSENASVVSCTIVTGRTHQIRIHLQFLGHPIIGDRLYNDEGWGPEKGKAANYGERTREQLAHDIGTRHSKANWIIEKDEEYEQRIRQIGEDEECTVDEFDLKNLDACLKAMPAFDPLCWGCAIKKKREMQERDWLMALHCHRYSGDGWAYEAPLPDWATTEIEADSDPQQGEEEENAMNGDGTDNQQKQRRSSSTTTTPATTKTTAGEETVPKNVAPPTAMTEEEDDQLVPKNAQNAL